MESVISALGKWNSFTEVKASEEADFMSHLLDNFSVPPYSSFRIPSTFWPNHELTTSLDAFNETSAYFSDNITRNPHYQTQEYNSCDANEIMIAEPTNDYKLSANSRKRSCSVADVYENREKVKCRKIQKLVSKTNAAEVEHGAVFGQVMNVYRSDGESNLSQESSIISPRPKEGDIVNSNGSKAKATRSATDPQSVYARKRRERINERLKILQKLVPNGTKVDISTMLEEAVEYVKFLQLQIKLLSSDDMWMYAPIAYNGMDIGLDLTIPSPR